MKKLRFYQNGNTPTNYIEWKEAIKKHKGIDIDNDPTYDYEGYYSSNPEAAWAMLKNDPKAHFTDKFKTALHPSFSEESIYSGNKNKYNPKGIKGGRWVGNGFVMSQDMLDKSDYDVSRTRQYFKRSESQPLTIYVPDGSIMLDNVTVTPKNRFNKYESGGELIKKYFNHFLELVGLKKEDEYKRERVRPNDSPTPQGSAKAEDTIAAAQNGLDKEAAHKGIKPPKEYYIPYIIEKEISIPGVGRVSSNVLDSLAVNAERAEIPIKEALGLASMETKFGAAPNISTAAFEEKFKEKNNRLPTEEEKKAYERVVLNASYMRNYGGIYPQYLVNNHEWTKRGWEQSSKHKDLGEITNPLVYAFTLYKRGLYNPGESTHTSKVKKEGNRLMSLPVIKKWYEEYKHNADSIKQSQNLQGK